MKATLFFISVLLMYLTVNSVKAQDMTECEKGIRQLYNKKGQVDSHKGYYVKYGVQTVYKDKSVSDKEIIFTMMYKNEQIHVYSELLNTFADTSMIISLSPVGKRIVIGNSSKKDFYRMVNSATQMSDSSLWNKFAVLSCKQVINKKEYDTEAVLKPKKSDASVTEMIYLYQQESSALYEIVSKYDKSSPMDKLTYTFYKIDYSYSGAEMQTKNVYSLVFDTKGKLLPAYKNYEVIDQRNKK